MSCALAAVPHHAKGLRSYTTGSISSPVLFRLRRGEEMGKSRRLWALNGYQARLQSTRFRSSRGSRPFFRLLAYSAEYSPSPIQRGLSHASGLVLYTRLYLPRLEPSCRGVIMQTQPNHESERFSLNNDASLPRRSKLFIYCNALSDLDNSVLLFSAIHDDLQ